MGEDELSNLEKRLVSLSVQRHRRLFYRWGHLLCWLAFPLLGLMFIPAIKPYAGLLSWCAVALLFLWYFLVSTGVMAKLQVRMGSIGSSTWQTNRRYRGTCPAGSYHC